MALVHDLAECLIGDLLPNEVSKEEKYKREKVKRISFSMRLPGQFY